MKRLPLRVLEADGTRNADTYLAGDGQWKEIIIPDALPSGGSSAKVLTTQADGSSAWFGNVSLLLENGATVPEGTPVGTIVFQKGAP